MDKDFIPHFTVLLINYLRMLSLKLIHVNKKKPQITYDDILDVTHLCLPIDSPWAGGPYH